VQHYFIDRYSQIDSFIHRLDPRIKLIVFPGLILFIIFTPPSAYLGFAAYGLFILGLILLSRIPRGFIFRRSLTVVPFILLIAVFIPFVKQGEVAGAFSLGGLKLNVTYAGLTIFFNVLIKSYLCILSLILLTNSTKFSRLLKGLESLRCPKVIVMILAFMYRYIFVLLDELMRLKRARQARSFGENSWLKIRTLARIVGVLFIRAYERGERVYFAMCSRGYKGKILTAKVKMPKPGDFYFLGTTFLILTLIHFLT
jgi:cobalt/nickel transport system permease protein